MTTTTPERTFDAFVSYRHREPDKTWERKTLVPQLEAEGLRVFIDYRDFKLGAPVVTDRVQHATVGSRSSGWSASM